MGEITAHADDEEERQMQVVQNVPQRVAGLEQAGALDDDNRLAAAEIEAGGQRDGLSLAANADQLQAGRGAQSGVPLADVAIGDPHDMSHAAVLQRGDDRRTIEHDGASRKSRSERGASAP